MPNGNWNLREMRPEELDGLYKAHMEPVFPSAERPSLTAMHRHVKRNLQTIWIMTDGTKDAAYAVCAEHAGTVLITLLAVFESFRGGGRGGALMELLREKYKGKRSILLEVEDPKDAQDESELHIRQRRIAFYRRNGYQLLPEIRHVSFGVPLLIMALPQQDSLEAIRMEAVDHLQAIYHIILPEDMWPNVVTGYVKTPASNT